MITYVKGDLLESDCNLIIHGCNCFHSMSSGIAKQIKEWYPLAYQTDLQSSIYGDKNKLGKFTHCIVPHKNFGFDLVVVNGYTQYKYGRDPNIVYADYNAIRSVMEAVKFYFPNNKIGFPLIGCGLARGDRNIVEQILNEVFNDKEVFLYELEQSQSVNQVEIDLKQKYKSHFDALYKDLLNKN